MPEVLTFGAWLKERRKALDLTQAELARQVGCSVQLIEKWEAGSRRPSKQVAVRLAECLALPVEEQTTFVAWARAPIHPQAIEPSRRLSPHLAAKAAGGSRTSSLPAPLNALIGRTQEVAAVIGLLEDPAVRLVTLVGPPGIGKTRLALAVAEAVARAGDREVVFVPLAAIRDPALVPGTIARALGLQETGRSSLMDRLSEYLSDHPLLLVLDNFEQITAAAPMVSQLLTAAPRCKCWSPAAPLCASMANTCGGCHPCGCPIPAFPCS